MPHLQTRSIAKRSEKKIQNHEKIYGSDLEQCPTKGEQTIHEKKKKNQP